MATHRHGAQCDLPVDRGQDDPDVGAVERGRRYQTEHEAPAVASQCQASVLAEQPFEYVAVAIEES